MSENDTQKSTGELCKTGFRNEKNLCFKIIILNQNIKLKLKRLNFKI